MTSHVMQVLWRRVISCSGWTVRVAWVAIEITRREMSAGELRNAAARSRHANATRRMLALALVLEGHSRGDAAQMCGMDRQTLRDWLGDEMPAAPLGDGSPWRHGRRGWCV